MSAVTEWHSVEKYFQATINESKVQKRKWPRLTQIYQPTEIEMPATGVLLEFFVAAV